MNRILVAVDGSEPSIRAAQLAADIAVKMNARLTLAHVYVPAVFPAEAAWIPAVDLERSAQQHAVEVLKKATEQVRRDGLEVGTLVLSGAAAETLADAAKAEDFDLVVVGSRGRGAVARVFIGSVADRLVHISTKPVLVVR